MILDASSLISINNCIGFAFITYSAILCMVCPCHSFSMNVFEVDLNQALEHTAENTGRIVGLIVVCCVIYVVLDLPTADCIPSVPSDWMMLYVTAVRGGNGRWTRASSIAAASAALLIRQKVER